MTEKTRTRLNWETARRWSYMLEFQILGNGDGIEQSDLIIALIKEMRREE